MVKRQCGYANTCVHPNPDISQYIDWDANTTVTPVDNKTHLITGKIVEETRCEDCSSWIDRKVIAENGTKQQYFVIELSVADGDKTSVERYGFRYDEKTEAWIFAQMETAE